jgi:two-component system, OmpR family, response regulator
VSKAGVRGIRHILVVDDDAEVCIVLKESLCGEGYQVSIAHDGEGMRRVIAQAPVDLVLLDLKLPGEDGLSLCRMLRQQTTANIIMLTGRGEAVDRIVGLEMGADDYLAKPFMLRELLARVKSVLRRTRARTVRAAASASAGVRFAGWELNPASRQLRAPSGREVALSAGEYDLLATFVNHPNQVLSRDRLLELMYHREAGPFDRSIDVQVGRLRRKLDDDPQQPAIIKTVRGAGYVLAPLVETVTSPRSQPANSAPAGSRAVTAS